jgi:predicted type IV restriction endonuclease
MNVIERAEANGVQYQLISNGRHWCVRYTHRDHSTIDQPCRSEAAARQLFASMVRGARLLQRRKQG